MSSIEDVIMNGNDVKLQRKGHPFILIFLFILIVALCFLIYFRFFYGKDEIIDYTEDFFEYISSSNIKTFLNDSLYNEILQKIETKDFEVSHSINMSTTMEKQEFADIDLSKIIVNIDSINKKENNKIFYDANIKYLDNQLINCKAIENEDELYVVSDEIVDRYIGGEKNSFYPILFKILNKENLDYSKINNLKNVSKNRIEYKDLDVPIYAKIIKDNIEPGKIQKNDNVIIQEENENIEAVEYKLQLSQEETNKIIIAVLEKLKEDEDLLNKFTNAKLSKKIETDNTENTTNTEQIVEESNVSEANTVENSVQTIPNNNLDTSEVKSPVSNIKISNNEITEENKIDTDDVVNQNTIEEAKEIIKSAILKEERNVSLTDLQNAIQKIIDEISNINQNGITLSIYVENEKIVKLNIDLMNNSNLDIKFKTISEKENQLNITYLIDTEKTTGYSIELYKNKNDVTTEFDILYNNIENKKIIKKLKIETNLKGTVLSNSIDNTILLTYTDATGEFKTNITTELIFDTEKQIEELNENNSFNLITTEEMYRQNLIEQLKSTIETVYNSKKEQMKLIENNTSSSEIPIAISEENENQNLDNTKEELKQILADKISSMLTEAQNNNKEFELNKLNGLEIEDHRVSTIINSDLAIITIDGYTFNIDSEFNLSDGQN